MLEEGPVRFPNPITFIRSMFRHGWANVRGYHVIASPGVQEYRFKQCRKCEHNDEGQCQLCSCLVLAKTIMAMETCPDRRWSAEWKKRTSK